MPRMQVFINAPPDEVFPAISDLTRHAPWATHALEIEAMSDGKPAVGSEYKCSHKNKEGDRVTITGISPNERFSFHAVMPNRMEVAHIMTLTPQNEGTVVAHEISLAKVPGLMALFKPLMVLLVNLAAKGPDGKFLNNMKAELEQDSQ